MCDRSKTNLHLKAGGSEHLGKHNLIARHFTDTLKCSFIFLLRGLQIFQKKKINWHPAGRWEETRVPSFRPVGPSQKPQDSIDTS